MLDFPPQTYLFQNTWVDREVPIVGKALLPSYLSRYGFLLNCYVFSHFVCWKRSTYMRFNSMNIYWAPTVCLPCVLEEKYPLLLQESSLMTAVRWGNKCVRHSTMWMFLQWKHPELWGSWSILFPEWSRDLWAQWNQCTWFQIMSLTHYLAKPIASHTKENEGGLSSGGRKGSRGLL